MLNIVRDRSLIDRYLILSCCVITPEAPLPSAILLPLVGYFCRPQNGRGFNSTVGSLILPGWVLVVGTTLQLAPGLFWSHLLYLHPTPIGLPLQPLNTLSSSLPPVQASFHAPPASLLTA